MMKTIRYPLPELYHDYLGIPYDEEVVPFPNFGSVLIQHRRYIPDAPAFSWFQKKSYSFFDWTSCVRTLSGQLLKAGLNSRTPVIVERVTKPEMILLFHALMDAGIPAVVISGEEPFHNFPEDLTPVAIDGYVSQKFPVKIVTDIPFPQSLLSQVPLINDPVEIPYVRLDYPAVYARVQNVWAEYSQYNILSAAQSVGKEFSFFRAGRVSFSKTITDLSDWLIAVITPCYYGSEVRFDEPFRVEDTENILKEKKIQVVITDIEPDQIIISDVNPNDSLRDAAFICIAKDNKLSRRKLPYPWRELWTDDRCSGNGYIFNGLEARMCKAMDFQIFPEQNHNNSGQLILAGHSLPNALFLPDNNEQDIFLKKYFLTPMKVRVPDNNPPDFILLEDQ